MNIDNPIWNFFWNLKMNIVNPMDVKFINEPMTAWFLWLGAMILFMVAWQSVIRLTVTGARAVAENV